MFVYIAKSASIGIEYEAVTNMLKRNIYIQSEIERQQKSNHMVPPGG
jgi:hypothetical protein